MSEKHVVLFYKEGTSDKEYRVHLLPKAGKWVVNIEYGRRGSSLTVSSKTPVPVDLDTASTIFDKQVHAKKLKGYTEAAGTAPYVGSDKGDKITGVLPQLLNNVAEEDLDELFDQPGWCMQEKKDGKRILLRNKNGLVEAINRKGLLVSFPEDIQKRALSIKAPFVVDGEMIGDVIWLFDVLEFDGQDLRKYGYHERHKILIEEFITLDEDNSAIQLIPTAFIPERKRKVFKKLKEQGVEGVVFKRTDAPYTAGRPASKGNQLKFKFKQTCTAQVAGKVEGKRSVYVQLLDGTNLVDVGKVTILPNFEIPTDGTLVEIEYLYRHVHGALYQPVYLGERDDLEQPDQAYTLKIKEGIDLDEDSDG